MPVNNFSAIPGRFPGLNQYKAMKYRVSVKCDFKSRIVVLRRSFLNILIVGKLFTLQNLELSFAYM